MKWRETMEEKPYGSICTLNKLLHTTAKIKQFKSNIYPYTAHAHYMSKSNALYGLRFTGTWGAIHPECDAMFASECVCAHLFFDRWGNLRLISHCVRIAHLVEYINGCRWLQTQSVCLQYLYLFICPSAVAISCWFILIVCKSMPIDSATHLFVVSGNEWFPTPICIKIIIIVFFRISIFWI